MLRWLCIPSGENMVVLESYLRDYTCKKGEKLALLLSRTFAQLGSRRKVITIYVFNRLGFIIILLALRRCRSVKVTMIIIVIFNMKDAQ